MAWPLARSIDSARLRAEPVQEIETSGIARGDLVFCERLLSEVSRTFALSIQSLPTELRNAVCVAYLLCRTVDTVEDDPQVTPLARRELFDAFDAALTAAAAGDASLSRAFEVLAQTAKLGAGSEAELCSRAGAVFRPFAALPPPVRALIQPRLLQMSHGMRAYSERAQAEGRLQIRDLPDLELYCYYVAGTVGELLTDLFMLACPVDSTRRAELIARSVRFGLALQLVNILKDVVEDSQRGACFLPKAQAEAEGLDLSRLLEPTQRAAGLRLLRTLARRAREHLHEAEQYTRLWPLTAAGREVRLFCAGPLALALGTLREVEHGDDALRKDRAPTVSRLFVLRTFEQMKNAVGAPEQAESDRLLALLFDRARVGVAGRPVRPAVPPVEVGEQLT
ncbi:MAG TPA: squalene/phytoene synthase family protein [Polyangiales bacterium]|nr:squalene/phytoene synthase family protein [Polyangiales bacterium]